MSYWKNLAEPLGSSLDLLSLWHENDDTDNVSLVLFENFLNKEAKRLP